jgi:hypothetical protein
MTEKTIGGQSLRQNRLIKAHIEVDEDNILILCTGDMV